MRNPVITGFYPDPSICAAGDYFYLATSSFAFYPGIPLFRSANLVEWEQIGHALVENHLDFTPLEISDGVWAPTIRFHQGTFYLVFSVSHGPHGMKTYLITSQDPAGTWSAPKQLHIEGFDPSLFFEGERAWLTICRDAVPTNPHAPGALWLAELDLATQEIVGPETLLWDGALKGAWVEAPRIYKHENTYWLIAAEGGTERKHAVTAAYSQSITGPYRGDDRNPLLTHRHLGESSEIANVGHADLVEDSDGNWWAVALGVRPIEGHHVLGREVFLLPITWDSQGLVCAPGDGRLHTDIGTYRALNADVPDSHARLQLLKREGSSTPPSTVVQVAHQLAWVSPLKPMEVHTTEGDLMVDLFDNRSVWLNNALMTRQRAHTFEFSASLETETNPSVRSIYAFQNRNRYIKLSHTPGPRGASLTCERNLDGVISFADMPNALMNVHDLEPVTLRITSNSTSYEFLVEVDGKRHILWTEPHEFFSTESAGGFVGTMLGVSATDLSQLAHSSENRGAQHRATFRCVTMTSHH